MRLFPLALRAILHYEQIFPAFQAMIIRGHFDMPIIGVAKSAWSLAQVLARARESLEKHGGLDPGAFARLSARLQSVSGDYDSPDTFRRLRRAHGAALHPLYYLAAPPDLFATNSIFKIAKNAIKHHNRRNEVFVCF